MLDITIASEVKKQLDLDDYHFSLEEIMRMSAVPQMLSSTVDYTILNGQFGNCTIMVWIHLDEEGHVTVQRVRTQPW